MQGTGFYDINVANDYIFL